MCLQEGIDEEYQIMYVGCLSVDVDPMEQEVREFHELPAVQGPSLPLCILTLQAAVGGF